MTDDELLTPKPPRPHEGLRAELLGRTARRVRFVGRMRTATRVAVCLLCFAAGAATTFLRPAPEAQTVYVEVPAAPAADAPGSPPPVVRALSPAELELEAEKASAKAESARLFREAGDRYLRDYADYRAALRCYRNFLDEADADALTVSPDDTWLLTSLKRARAQESTQ
jgi:hypothetical protein